MKNYQDIRKWKLPVKHLPEAGPSAQEARHLSAQPQVESRSRQAVRHKPGFDVALPNEYMGGIAAAAGLTAGANLPFRPGAARKNNSRQNPIR